MCEVVRRQDGTWLQSCNVKEGSVEDSSVSCLERKSLLKVESTDSSQSLLVVHGVNGLCVQWLGKNARFGRNLPLTLASQLETSASLQTHCAMMRSGCVECVESALCSPRWWSSRATGNFMTKCWWQVTVLCGREDQSGASVFLPERSNPDFKKGELVS
jgi:hypothetical protein